MAFLHVKQHTNIKMKISRTNTWRYRIHASTTLIPLLILAGCLGGEPPTEADVTAITTKFLELSNAISGWKPVEVHVSNLKCNRSGDAYACSYDMQAKMRQSDFMTGKVKESDLVQKGMTGKYIKAGEVWTPAL